MLLRTRWLFLAPPLVSLAVLAGCGPMPEDDLETDELSAEITVTTGCRPLADQVAIFSNNNFGGSCAVLNVGSYAKSGSSGFGLGNDAVSSVIVGSKVMVRLYQNNSFGGSSVALQGTHATLGSFNDKTSSIKVECAFPSRAPVPVSSPPSRAPTPVGGPPSRAPTPVLDPPSRAPTPVPGVCG